MERDMKTAIGILVFTLWAVGAKAATECGMHVLPISGNNVSATAVNDSGLIVGKADSRAFMRQHGVTQFLTALDGSQTSEAYAVNNSGRIVGRSRTAAGSLHATIWDNGVPQDLGAIDPLNDFSSAWGVNDPGHVVGSSIAADGTIHAFLWKGQELIDLQDDFPSLDAAPIAINDSGQIVGYDTNPATGRFRPFIWQEGMVEYLGSEGIANDINDAGQAVGFSFDVDGGARAFLWENGVMMKLGSLGHGSYPQAINNRGWLTGLSYPHSHGRAALWKNGRIVNLGVAGSGKGSSAASDINASGLIVGSTTIANGTGTRAFRWKKKC